MNRLRILLKNILAIPYRIFLTKISCMCILQESKVDKKAAICAGTKIYRSSIAKYSYVGRNCFINNAIIGKFTSIAENCYIGSAKHPIEWVSASPCFCKGKNILDTNFAEYQYNPYEDTKIGNDVWIGEGCKIKAGITIGDGAVIGMGSVVTKNVEPYAIYAGNPARFIRSRFDDEVINSLIDIQWWDWKDETIKCYAEYFKEPKELIRKYRNEK